MAKGNVSPWTRIPDYVDPKEMTTGRLQFDDRKCTRCNTCTFICPARSIKRDASPSAWRKGLPWLEIVEPGITNCISCGCCVTACPEDAIEIVRGFNAGFFYRKLTQAHTFTYPKLYSESDEEPERVEPAMLKPSLAGQEPDIDPPPHSHHPIRQTIQRFRLFGATVFGFTRFIAEDASRKGWMAAIKNLPGKAADDLSWAELLEERAATNPSKPFLLYGDETITYAAMDQNANRAANFFMELGGGKGKGVGILMQNSPRFLDIFLGAQKIGMYTVPINPNLMGDALAYVINHSDIEYLVLDAKLLDTFMGIEGELRRLKFVLVNDFETDKIHIPNDMMLLSQAWAKMPSWNPDIGFDRSDICLILYTSGTTGPPKGVVHRYRSTGVKRLTLLSRTVLKPDDVYYTCLPLCHGNALLATFTMSLGIGGTMVLSRKFSPRRFWNEIRQSGATVFNTIGSMIPILLKQPEHEDDRKNRVRIVLSTTCPDDMWGRFEDRFGVRLYEGYGMFEDGGKGLMNFGTAPRGSLGKPSAGLGKSVRIIDDTGAEVPIGLPGELAFKADDRRRLTEYYKDEAASRDRVKGGWVHTGHLVRADKKGFLYFVGRTNESMRKDGENISAYEMEHLIMKHPAVEEVAVYPIQSESGEDEIMAAVKPVSGESIDPGGLIEFLSDKMARFARPRYIRFVDNFPKTASHRIIKSKLQSEGITADTVDAMANQ